MSTWLMVLHISHFPAATKTITYLTWTAVAGNWLVEICIHSRSHSLILLSRLLFATLGSTRNLFLHKLLTCHKKLLCCCSSVSCVLSSGPYHIWCGTLPTSCHQQTSSLLVAGQTSCWYNGGLTESFILLLGLLVVYFLKSPVSAYIRDVFYSLSAL